MSTSDPNANAGVTGQPGNTTTITYDAYYHTFPEQITNSLGHRKRFAYSNATGCASNGYASYPAGGGLVQLETGPNDADNTGTIRCYDVFGRIAFELGSGGLSRASFGYNDVYSATTPIYAVRNDRATTGGGTRQTFTFFDRMGRVNSTLVTGPQQQGTAAPIQQNRGYDSSGRVAWEEAPHFIDKPAATTIYAYDALDRVKTVDLPGPGRVTTISQVLGLVTVTDPSATW